MVSFWPWGRDQSSPESFEKKLSALAASISKTVAQNDNLRQRARRFKVGWTLYGGFTYILAFLILTLVTGWRNWGAVEYTVVAGGPLMFVKSKYSESIGSLLLTLPHSFSLYAVRALLTTWYNYRTSSREQVLESLYKERDETIEKLKRATKYNSTQQLLEKYGTPKQGSPKQSKSSPNSAKKKKPSEDRVFISPPPTANIPRGPQSQPTPPRQQLPPFTNQLSPHGPVNGPFDSNSPPRTAEFAPNAFSEPPKSNYLPNTSFAEPRWYDRILDALLGEDETQARNRLALICTRCRLINGLAPPGAKSLEDVGKWRCTACGAWNGEESDIAKRVKEAVQASDVASYVAPDADPESEVSAQPAKPDSNYNNNNNKKKTTKKNISKKGTDSETDGKVEDMDVEMEDVETFSEKE